MTGGTVRREPKKFAWKKVSWPLALACAFFYIGFHAMSGERGLYAWFKENRRLEVLKAELAATTASREEYERKIRLLSNNSLDLDMLDEQARSVLGFVGADEVVIFTANAQPSAVQ